MKIMLLAAAATATAIPAYAEDWRLVSATPEHNAAFMVDVDSMKAESATLKRVRLMLILAAGMEQYDAVTTENVIDCSAAKQQIGPGTAYDGNGKIIAKDTKIDDTWEPIIPDSNYDMVADAVCGRKPMPAEKFPAGVPIAPVRAALAKM